MIILKDIFYNIKKVFGDEPQPYKHPSFEFTQIDKIFDDIECDFYETESRFYNGTSGAIGAVCVRNAGG